MLFNKKYQIFEVKRLNSDVLKFGLFFKTLCLGIVVGKKKKLIYKRNRSINIINFFIMQQILRFRGFQNQV